MNSMNLTAIAGIILIVVGLISLGYEGFTYTSQEKVAELKIGGASKFEVTEQKEKVFSIPPIFGGASLIVGVILMIITRLKKPKG
jgi:hypothetical protein